MVVYTQYLLPKRLITLIAGWLAESRRPWLKNLLIKGFMKRYHIDMSEAVIQNPLDYPTFNDFFTRKLDMSKRPFVQSKYDIASPADGTIVQIGEIRHHKLLQAKHQYFKLQSLLGDDAELTYQFSEGAFATIYLAPHNYHRVHMPVDGTLVKTIFVPGSLFSVNNDTIASVPHLYSRNERLICVFNSAAGDFAVVLVGAMIVGSIQTAWMREPVRSNKIVTTIFNDDTFLPKGSELGHFKLGSTVILLTGKHTAIWLASRPPGSVIKTGQLLGKLCLKSNITA
jgi:phosphatidylserine decarboxylase